MGEYENGTYIPDALELNDLRAAGRIPARFPTNEDDDDAYRPLKHFEDKENEEGTMTDAEIEEFIPDYDEHTERQEYKHDEH